MIVRLSPIQKDWRITPQWLSGGVDQLVATIKNLLLVVVAMFFKLSIAFHELWNWKTICHDVVARPLIFKHHNSKQQGMHVHTYNTGYIHNSTDWDWDSPVSHSALISTHLFFKLAIKLSSSTVSKRTKSSLPNCASSSWNPAIIYKIEVSARPAYQIKLLC